MEGKERCIEERKENSGEVEDRWKDVKERNSVEWELGKEAEVKDG